MKKIMISIFLVFAAVACGDDDKPTETVIETPEAEACEHLAEGPAQLITAAAASTDTLENAALEHTRVDVTLTDYEGAKGGFVAFEADATGDFLFFLSNEAPFAIFDNAGAKVEFEKTTFGSDLCTDIAVTYTVELSVGTYVLAFGPTSESEVSLVHELSGAEHDHGQ